MIWVFRNCCIDANHITKGLFNTDLRSKGDSLLPLSISQELTGRFSRASDSMKRLLEHRDLLAGASRSGHDEEVEHALLRERGGIQEAGRAIAEMAG